MLFNYLKLSLRLMVRNPFFTLVNIIGLSIGLATFLILWQYTSKELVSDEHHFDYQNKVRFTFKVKSIDKSGKVWENYISTFSPDYPSIFVNEMQSVKSYTRIYSQSYFSEITTGDHGKDIFISVPQSGDFLGYKEKNIVYADTNVFEFFSIPLITGNPKTVLLEPNSIVLSQSLAMKYFGNYEIMNSIILINNKVPLKVTGVYKDLPQNTHLNFDAVISMERIRQRYEANAGPDQASTIYFHLNSDVNRSEITNALNKSVKKYLAPMMAELDLNPNDIQFFLQPLNEIVFSKYLGDNHKKKSRALLNTLQFIAITILIIAWINYLNMVIYANGKRMKELGVRKNFGADSIDFIFQFVVESAIVNFIGMMGALTLVQICKGIIQEFLQIKVSFFDFSSTVPFLILIVVTFGGIIITGIYPAANVLRRTTLSVFKNRFGGNKLLSNGLTVFQFSTAIVMIIAIFVVHNQLQFILQKDLGIKRDEVVVIDLPEVQNNPVSVNGLLNKLAAMRHVTGVALSSSVPGDNERNGVGIQRDAGSTFVGVATNGGVDENFLDFFNVKLLAGRNFKNGEPINERAIIVSRKALENLGFDDPEQCINREVLVEAKAWTHEMRPAIIIGVIEDYVRNPFTVSDVGQAWNDDTGLALTYWNYVDAENVPKKISLTLQQGSFQEGIEEVHHQFRQFFPRDLFNWYFLNDNINQHYLDQRYTRNQITVFTLIAVVIACLGLLGMISNRAEEKIKEIGIRKVLGARLHHITVILLQSTIKQIAIAAFIAVPIGVYMSNFYLQNFSARIHLQWWHFALPVTILILIMLATVTTVVWRAAKHNPVEALKYE